MLGAADARIPNLVTDKVDVIFQFMTITPGRAQQAEFTIPYYREGVGFMMMKGADHQTFDELKAGGGDITISALQNVFIEEWVHLALPDAKVDQYDSVDAEIQALNSRRAHAAALDQSTIGWLISQFPDRYVDSGYGWMPNSYAAGGQARRPGVAELRQHGAARGDDRGRLPELPGLVREVVRPEDRAAAGRLPGRVLLRRAALGRSAARGRDVLAGCRWSAAAGPQAAAWHASCRGALGR